MDQGQRVECLTGRSLDNCKDILDFPIEAALESPTLMNGKVGVIRAILTVITKVGLDSTRLKQMQDELLTRMIDDFATETAGQTQKPQQNGHS
jgi:hypothetical protein